jgi:hypothetical protein
MKVSWMHLLFYESCLLDRDDMIKFRAEPVSKDLRDNLSEAINQANRPIICDKFRVRLFGIKTTNAWFR